MCVIALAFVAITILDSRLGGKLDKEKVIAALIVAVIAGVIVEWRSSVMKEEHEILKNDWRIREEERAIYERYGHLFFADVFECKEALDGEMNVRTASVLCYKLTIAKYSDVFKLQLKAMEALKDAERIGEFATDIAACGLATEKEADLGAQCTRLLFVKYSKEFNIDPMLVDLMTSSSSVNNSKEKKDEP